MYGWIWRHLPGPWPVRLLTSLVLIAATALILMQWVFPAVAPYVPLYDETVSPSN